MWYLENIDAEGIFCPKKMDSFQQSHSILSYNKGDYVFVPEDKAESIYYISSGRVKIGTESDTEKTVTKAILSRGEIFGEMALAGVHRRRDYAIALEQTELCVISKSEMTNLFKDHNPLYFFIMKLIGSRALEMEKRLESLVFKDSRSRIIEFLITLNERKGQRVGYEWVIRKFMTHQDIANLTATSRQTVTTILNELKQKNILTFNRKRLLIRDLDQLKSELQTAQ
jgi:CRP-like cAMP-binding protein